MLVNGETIDKLRHERQRIQDNPADVLAINQPTTLTHAMRTAYPAWSPETSGSWTSNFK